MSRLQKTIYGILALIVAIGSLTYWFKSQAYIYTKTMYAHTESIATMKRIADALHLYSADNDKLLPHKFETDEDLRSALNKYLRKNDFTTLNPNGGVIIPNKLLEGNQLSSINGDKDTVLIYEAHSWPDNRKIYCFTNFRCQFLMGRE